MNGKDTYDITKYSDNELFNILDVINPTDRELEARILFLVHKYENMQNKSGDELANFFRKIYAHFFEVSDDEEEEYDVNDMVVNGEVEGFTINPDGTVDYGNTMGNTWSITGNVENEIIDNYDKYNGNSVPRDTFITQLANAVKTTTQDKNSVAYVNTLNYTQDKLNPLLKQTIKRIISIDSQYRDDKRTLSTQFTFNLSDPLKDVLSIKLYSIQIPYTWYTISTSYGSNFFYFKGNSPGINDGNYDYQFSIAPGNYSPTELVSTINTNIQSVKDEYKDVDFGNTEITYNSNTSRATINIDITKTYNETSYYLDFPTWTNPNDETTYNDTVNYVRKQSIPGFLGFNYQTYYPNILYSNFLSQPTDADTSTALYYIDPSANYFTIYKYIGPDEYDNAKSTIDLSFQIELSKKGVVVSRNDLITDVSNQLANSTYLINSTINRYNITDTSYAYDIDDTSLNTYYYLKGQGYSQFQLAIKFNRLTTNNNKFSKIYIEFPSETSKDGYNPIWTGASSCFHFPSLTNELNNIIAETEPVPDQLSLIEITSSPYIYLNCIESGYDISQNDYRIDISNNSTGYTLQGFTDNINKALVNINNYTKTANVFYSNVALGSFLSSSITDVSLNPYYNINGDFNIDNTTATIDSNSYFNVSLDINKKFTNDMYRVDTSGTSLKSLFSLSGEYLDGNADLNGTYTFSSTLPYQASYTLPSSNLLVIYPSNNNYGNQYSGTIIVTTTGLTDSFTNLQTSINNSFTNYKDSNGTNILDGTTIALDINDSNPNNVYIDCTFTIKIQKVISQNQYNILFYDASGYDSDGNFDYTQTSWNQLAIDASFMNLGVDLSSNISNITNSGTKTTLQMTEQILSNSIKFTNDNNYFYMKPYDAGVLSIDGANDIKVTIPAYNSENTQIIYSRTSLIGAINEVLSSTIYTYGSALSIYTVNSIEYTKFRINVTKIYTTKDYKLVFYDQQSFVKCYTGVSSVTNTTWDTTMGWILGFRETTEYDMADYYTSDIDPTKIDYYVNDTYKDDNKITLTGDTSVSVNLFNYFLLCLDDFNQNHLNDGLVTLSPSDTTVTLPSYANKSNFTCDPATGLLTYNTNIINPTTNSKLTQNQIYAITETINGSSSTITNASNISSKSFGTGPFVKDVFALIPIKTSGMQNGSVYVDFSGTLQNQERVYFGPVNIHRMSISLVSDRGDVVNLNGTNWSFSFLCEQLYQSRPMNS